MSNAKKYKAAEGLSEDEYLSKMRETDKLMPVITVVVYYGEKPWNGAASLHEMLNIPEEVVQYVNNYKMILTVAGAANCKLNYELEGDGGMWTVFEETQNEGRIKGIIEMGLECGLSEEDILEKLQQKLNVSWQKAF